MYGYIYITTNLVNNKIYIGQHKASKFEPDKYIGSGTLLAEAIKKYGIQNFKNELLCECRSQEELNEKEVYYIAIYNTTDRTLGYNIKLGGNQTPCPDSVKEKISAQNKGKYLDHVHIYKKDQEKHIAKEELNKYLESGWKIGRKQATCEALSKNYNYNSKGMLGKKQSEKQKLAASKANSYKRTNKQKANFSSSKKVPNKFICLRTPDNKSTIRCLIINKDKYLALGYTLCKEPSEI